MIEVPQPYYDIINYTFWIVIGYMAISTISIYILVYKRDRKLPTANFLSCTVIFTKYIVYGYLIKGIIAKIFGRKVK